MSSVTNPAVGKSRIDWSRIILMLVGVVLFAVVYLSPQWPDAVDPAGKHFALTREAKGALAIFLLAGIWWVFEVVPIGVTSLIIGMMQALFLVRPAKVAFNDFMDPSVMFIFASVMIGLVFTKTGLTRRMAYKMLIIVGEKTSMIYLGCFLVTAALTHIMAHTAVAATIYPLLLAIYSLYGEEGKPTKFGKGLFIGMAYVAGAGSIVTLLGAARGAVALGFYNQITNSDISFLQLSYYMFPIGWLMVFILWGFFMLFFQAGEKSHSGTPGTGAGTQQGTGADHQQGNPDRGDRFRRDPVYYAEVRRPGAQDHRQVRDYPDQHRPVFSYSTYLTSTTWRTFPGTSSCCSAGP